MYVNRIEGGPSPLREPLKQARKPAQREGAEFADAVESILSNAVEIIKDNEPKEHPNGKQSETEEQITPPPHENATGAEANATPHAAGTKHLNITV